MTEDGYFDDTVARTYDQDTGGDLTLAGQIAATLHALSGGGTALEFAIGTGRIALPLIRLGTPVTGIELSRAMVSELRKKPGGPLVTVAIGDMTTTRIAGQFSLVYLVFNTIDNLTTQDAQVACFQNAAAHLAPGGRFVIETQVPPLQKIPFGETTHAFACNPGHWGIDSFDLVTQTYTSNHIWFTDGPPRHLTIPFRYAWPAELDLMARLAGLTAEFRWSDWTRTPFTGSSAKHISIWRKPSP